MKEEKIDKTPLSKKYDNPNKIPEGTEFVLYEGSRKYICVVRGSVGDKLTYDIYLGGEVFRKNHSYPLFGLYSAYEVLTEVCEQKVGVGEPSCCLFARAMGGICRKHLD